jgi:ethanolamine transporter EutH
MVATLRVVLDQVVAPTDADLGSRRARLARALVATTPGGCEVAAIVPSAPDAAGDLEVPCPGSRT